MLDINNIERNAFKINLMVVLGLLSLAAIASYFVLGSIYTYAFIGLILFVIFLGIAYYKIPILKSVSIIVTGFLIPTAGISLTYFKEINIFLPVVIVIGASMIGLYWDRKLFIAYDIYTLLGLVVSFVINNDIFMKSGDTAVELITLTFLLGIAMGIISIIYRNGRQIIKNCDLQNNELKIKTDDIEKLIEDMKEKEKCTEELVNSIIANNIQIKTSNDVISSSLDSFSKSIQSNTADTLNVSSLCYSMSESLDSLVGKENEVKNLIDLLNGITNGNKENMNKLESSMSNIDTVNKDIANIYKQTVESFNIVNYNLQKLNSIARKTKMLAINAGIQAQNVGGSNKGFVVIANEVGNLADESDKLVYNIQESIETLHENLEATEKSIGESGKEVNSAKLILNTNVDKINEIIEMFSRLNAINLEKVEMIYGVKSSFSDIESAMSNISSIQEEQSATTQELNAICEEQTTVVNKTYSLCNDFKCR